MPCDIKNIQRARKKKDDEFYSPREQVECIFENYIARCALINKRIWLPADSENSQWVKYLKENKEKWQYKEIIATCDDFRTHKDILENVDIVITNPPFSLKTKLVRMCQDAGKDFILLWPTGTQQPENTYKYGYCRHKKHKMAFYTFIRPDGTFKLVPAVIVTSRKTLMRPVDEIKNIVKMHNITLSAGIKSGKIRIADDGKYEVNDVRNMPIDYFDWIYAPSSTLSMENNQTRDLFDIDFTPTAATINGKMTYFRYLARRKKGK